jgi:hypothetical protein
VYGPEHSGRGKLPLFAGMQMGRSLLWPNLKVFAGRQDGLARLR